MIGGSAPMAEDFNSTATVCTPFDNCLVPRRAKLPVRLQQHEPHAPPSPSTAQRRALRMISSASPSASSRPTS